MRVSLIRSLAFAASFASLSSLALDTASARGRFGGGAGRSMQVRSTSSSSVHWGGSSSVNRNVNVNRNVHHDVDIDVDHGYNHHWGDHYHPVARAATATAVTAAVVGSYYRYLPANCATIYRGTVVYYQCGTAWYQPVYAGTGVQYVVVNAP